MKTLATMLAAFLFFIYVPIVTGEQLPTSSIYCEVTYDEYGGYSETCTTVNSDGSTETCVSIYDEFGDLVYKDCF